MPEGSLFGVPRLSHIGPLSELTKEEKIIKSLEEFSTKVTHTDDRVKDRFTYRIDIPNGSRIEPDREIRDALPTHQNIPSNLSVVGDRAQGTIRPPNVSRRAISEEELHDGIKEVVTIDVEVFLPHNSKTFRPHIEVDRTSMSNYMMTVAEVHDDFVDIVLGEL